MCVCVYIYVYLNASVSFFFSYGQAIKAHDLIESVSIHYKAIVFNSVSTMTLLNYID